MVRRLEAGPCVESVTFARGVSLLWQSCCIAYLPEKGKAVRADYHAIAPRYFSTLRIPLLAGRDFAESDHAGSVAVAIVNQTMASRLDPSGAVVGRVFVADGKSLQVVGVVKDFYPRSAVDPSARRSGAGCVMDPGAACGADRAHCGLEVRVEQCAYCTVPVAGSGGVVCRTRK